MSALSLAYGKPAADLELAGAVARGWAFTPLRGKKPIRKSWQTEAPLALDMLEAHVARGGNLGLRTGAASGVVVLDVDGAKGGEVPDGLPETVTVETGGGGLHLYFTLPDGEPIPNSSGKVGKHVDVRGEGGQVVFPGSTHPETGAIYAWQEGRSPDDLPLAPWPGWLLNAAPAPTNGRAHTPAITTSDAAARCRRYVDKMPPAIAGNGGHDATFNAACECFRFGLADGDAMAILEEYNMKCSPPWAARDLDHKLADARGRVIADGEFGMRLQGHTGAPSTAHKPAARNAPTGTGTVESPAPLRLAEHFLEKSYTRRGDLLLRRNRGEWFAYCDAAYSVKSDEIIRAELYQALDSVSYPTMNSKGEPALKRVKPTTRIIGDVLDALPACGPLIDADMPAWIDTEKHPPAGECVALKNGILHIRGRKLMASTPAFFTTTKLPFEYAPDAPPAREWDNFLCSIWEDDEETKRTLQEWFGYCLTLNTRQQKITLIVGPPRSGKGTIARILSALLGSQNVCSPTLGALASQFGAASLIHKHVAIIADARLSGRTDIAQVVERLLSISGGDLQTIQRKHRADWTGYLSTRFMLLSNELPRLTDASGALASRFIVLPMEHSYLGKEDHALADRLSGELPSIFAWALEGYDRLKQRGHFVQPVSGRESMEDLRDLGSPIGAYVRERCVIDPAASIQCGDLFTEWQNWCASVGREHAGNAQTFARDLKSYLPSISTKQVRIGGMRERKFEGIGLSK